MQGLYSRRPSIDRPLSLYRVITGQLLSRSIEIIAGAFEYPLRYDYNSSSAPRAAGETAEHVQGDSKV